MDTNSLPILQLPLFVYGESVSNVVELFPAVWKATESLTSPDPVARQHGIDALVEVGAQKVSPLVAYVLATRINDPDVFIRRRVVFILADMITSESNGKQVPDEVRLVVTHTLHNMSASTVEGLLEVAVADQQADKPIYHLFNACPYVGRFLGDFLTQWKNPLQMRQKAIYFIGEVGYLEALPVLERLLNRVEARQQGQFSMSFAPPSAKSDDELIPFLRIAINQLNSR